jgi:hypothetical protein
MTSHSLHDFFCAEDYAKSQAGDPPLDTGASFVEIETQYEIEYSMRRTEEAFCAETEHVQKPLYIIPGGGYCLF